MDKENEVCIHNRKLHSLKKKERPDMSKNLQIWGENWVQHTQVKSAY
jgi:hypothetical protein